MNTLIRDGRTGLVLDTAKVAFDLNGGRTKPSLMELAGKKYRQLRLTWLRVCAGNARDYIDNLPHAMQKTLDEERKNYEASCRSIRHRAEVSMMEAVHELRELERQIVELEAIDK